MISIAVSREETDRSEWENESERRETIYPVKGLHDSSNYRDVCDRRVFEKKSL